MLNSKILKASLLPTDLTNNEFSNSLSFQRQIMLAGSIYAQMLIFGLSHAIDSETINFDYFSNKEKNLKDWETLI